MIKKLLSLGALAFAFNAGLAQSNLETGRAAGPENRQLVSQTGASTAQNKVTTTNVTDTLWYFYNKYYYKTPTANAGFYTVKSPYQSAGAKLTHFGSGFLNTSTVTVNGMYMLASRRATSTSTSIPVHVLLCNATASGVPILPAIDSLTAVLTGTAGSFVGGALTTPRTITGNFAVIYKNASLVATDTIQAYMASTTPTTGISFGEALSSLRINGTFSTTPSAFGTDYEFTTIPIVTFPITTSVTPSAPSSTCVPTTYTFTNNSSPLLTNRQFNLNQFLARWQPFAVTPPVGDSIFIWNPGDGSGNVNNMPASFVHTYTVSGTFTGSITANYQLMAADGQKKTDMLSGPNTINNCIPTGINEASATEMVVFPNPSNGVVTVKNMGYNSTLELFNLLGESVYKEKVSEDVKTIDMSRLPAGNYYLKVTSAEGKATIKKLHFN